MRIDEIVDKYLGEEAKEKECGKCGKKFRPSPDQKQGHHGYWYCPACQKKMDQKKLAAKDAEDLKKQKGAGKGWEKTTREKPKERWEKAE